MSMINDGIDNLKKLQQALLDHLDKNDIDYTKDLIQFLDNEGISKSQYLLRDFLCLISKISRNHHRNQFFWTKIDYILSHYQKEIKENFSSSAIYNIFQNDKRILYFLFNNNFLSMDEKLYRIMALKYEYINENLVYFIKELSPFLSEYNIRDNIKRYPEISDYKSDSFDQKRKIGENSDYICELIRKDSIIEFITYINQNNISLEKRRIKLSIFETNHFLTKFREYSLIEYAAFFGSIEIFKYLYTNGVKIKPSIFLFAIHGRNPEIINFLENHIKPVDTTYKIYLKESIKCHHNEIINYIKENFNYTESNTDVYLKNLKYLNFIYLSENNANDLNDSQILCHFCRFGCCSIVNLFIENKKFDVNSQIIVEKERKDDYNDYNDDNDNDEEEEVYMRMKIVKKCIASPIHFAVLNKNIELVDILLKRSDLDINLKGQFIETIERIDDFQPSFEENDEEKTALLIAIDKGDIKIIELLLRRNDIDINQKSNYKKFREFQEFCCCYAGSTLLKSKEIKKSQISAIHNAIFTKKYEIVELLLKVKDIDINSEYVVEKNDWVDLEGEKSERENNYKKTAIQLANDYLNKSIFNLLNNHKNIIK